MAYNRTYNPDSLPAFAEPERKSGTPSSHSSTPSQAPQNNYSHHPTSPPPQQSTYAQGYNKPPPPLPRPEQRQSDHRQSDHRQPDQRHSDQRYSDQRPSDNYPGGRRLSPQTQPPSKYGHSSSSSGSNHGYASPPPSNHGYTSPPPGAYNSRPPQAQARPPHVSRPPPSPAPPNGADPALWPLFKAVDKDGSGQLSEKELRSALVNGDWSSFDPYTVKMMIRMFDTDRSGTIGFDEFCGLWGFLAAWRGLFDRFDADRSGTIDLDEYTNALVAFGYRLSPQFVDTLFRTLKRMTDVFKKYDDDRDGYITLSFEDFLTEIIRQK
ncbi:hypothetical protein G7Y89_g10794 [Cudoniella acicularis]|uniref:EF-hand domain-containing protein n=1 Tax=Cudoniella acicularis TaxID=354080 RepID=A0A8H4RED7_9HELO|nr:hypothetical protein G7Y89_g10794 [Cudoniella acicularis]